MDTVDGLIARVQQRLNLTGEDTAMIVGVSLDTLANARTGTRMLPAHAGTQLSALADLEARLLDTFDSPEAVQIWLMTKRRWLHDRSPLDTLRGGAIDRVDGALEALDAGIFL